MNFYKLIKNTEAKWCKVVAELGVVEAKADYARILEKKGNLHEALEWYLEASEQGDSSVQYRIGKLYGKKLSDKMPDAIKESNKWYIRAAKQGNAKAMYALGENSIRGIGMDKSIENAFAYYLKAAEQGDSRAQVLVAKSYLSGSNVSQSYTEAFKWYMKAAEQGNTEAQLEVGDAYFKGKGAEKSVNLAYKWLLKAAMKGSPRGQYCAGVLAAYDEIGDYKQSFKLLKKAAKKGIIKAQLRLGRYYKAGKGTKCNYLKAYLWFEKAAKAGNSDAIYEQAVLLKKGLGVGKNKKKSERLYLKAYQKGCSCAEYIPLKTLDKKKIIARKYDNIKKIMLYEYFRVPDISDVYYDFKPNSVEAADLDYIAYKSYIEENPKNSICKLLDITSVEYDILSYEGNEYLSICKKIYETLYEEYGKEWNIFLVSLIEVKKYLPADTIYKITKIANIFENTEDILPYENNYFHTLSLLWFEKAAELGDADAQFNCAKHWRETIEWSDDDKYQNEIKWLSEAAKNGVYKALAYLKRDCKKNEYEDTLAFLAESNNIYLDILLEEMYDGNEYARELLQENFYFKNECEYEPVGIFTDYDVECNWEKGVETFYDSLNYVMDSFTAFIIEGRWHYGMRDSSGRITKNKNEWPTPMMNNGEIEWVDDYEKYEPIIWFGIDNETPIEEWTLSKEEFKFSDFYGEIWWKAFWFPKRNLYNWDILLGEDVRFVQDWMFDEFELEEPNKKRLMKNCPVELNEDDSDERLKNKIDLFFLAKLQQIQE